MLKYFLIRLAPTLFLVALGYSFFMPSAGERQFTRMEAALNKAQSYRLEMTGQDEKASSYNLIEVACPDREHTIERTTFLDLPPDSTIPEQHIERIMIGRKRYLKSTTGDDWLTMSSSGRRAVGCAGATSPAQGGLLPAFKLVRALGHIEKGGIEEVAGESCRQWNVTFHQPNGTEKRFEYCINPDDNLPRRIRIAENSIQYTFSNWNQPIDIETPTALMR